MELDKKVTATKSAVSGSIAGGGGFAGYLVVIAAKKVFKMDISPDEGMVIVASAGAVAAFAGRAVENAVRFYAKLKKIAAESK